MKLKKEHIQEMVDGLDYLGHIAYPYFSNDDCASIIAENIIPYYLENVHNKPFNQIYKMVFYNSFEPYTHGYYLGIPFCNVENTDEVFSRKAAEYENQLPLKIKSIEQQDSNICTLIDRIDKIRSDIQNLNFSIKICHKHDFKLMLKENTIKKEQYEKELKQKEDEYKNIQRPEHISRQIALAQKEFDQQLLKKRIIDEYTNIANQFESAVKEKIEKAKKHKQQYENDCVTEFLCFILKDSFYPFDFDCNPQIEHNKDNKLLVVDYYLPTIDEIPNIKEIKEYKTRADEIKYLSNNALNKLYDDIIYKIAIRSIAEIFHFDDLKKVDLICFNGRVKIRNKATGLLMDNCILSVQVNRKEFESIDLEYIDCKACFKHFKGVSGAKLHDQAPIVPLMQLDTEDKRFVTAHSVETNESTNLATMDWEEFEHLVRELFELEFNVNGGEVKITQASRDGGVDAVAFDPDPIRGGKIVIQAKRYTNTVGVSAVRDLYGTVINEGANKGILITTSDYGTDSYNFAKGKPITLLNGGHLMFLLEKHNKKARIDLKEAKKHNDEE